MNKAAQQLGRLAAGVPKNFSADELQRRREHMTELNRVRALSGSIKGNAHQRRTAKRKSK